jgi:hypothetical protein
MSDTEGTGNVRTDINSRTARVVFDVDGKIHCLKIPTKRLTKTENFLFAKEPKIINKYIVPQEVLGFTLYFPADNTLFFKNKLREMWDKLVEFGFKKA